MKLLTVINFRTTVTVNPETVNTLFFILFIIFYLRFKNGLNGKISKLIRLFISLKWNAVYTSASLLYLYHFRFLT